MAHLCRPSTFKYDLRQQLEQPPWMLEGRVPTHEEDEAWKMSLTGDSRGFHRWDHASWWSPWVMIEGFRIPQPELRARLSPDETDETECTGYKTDELLDPLSKLQPHPQNQSPLFRLPREIRLLIWEYCVGHRFIFQPMWQPTRKFPERRHAWEGTLTPTYMEYPEKPRSWPYAAHISAPKPPARVHYPCMPAVMRCEWQFRKWPQTWWELTEPNLRLQLFVNDPLHDVCYVAAHQLRWTGLELVLSCREICRETLQLLYGLNTFSFGTLEHHLAFRRLVPPSCFRFVRYLHFSLSPSPSGDGEGFTSHASWRAHWNGVARDMPALRELDLNIRHIPDHKSERCTKCLMPPSTSAAAWRQFFGTLPQWLDDLAPLEGKLRRANIAFRDECESHSRFQDPAWRPFLRRVLDKCFEWQARITRDGNGGWGDLLDYEMSRAKYYARFNSRSNEHFLLWHADLDEERGSWIRNLMSQWMDEPAEART